MARRNNSSEIVEYIESLDISYEVSAPKLICKNPAINALIACEKCPDDKRYIDLHTEYSDDCKLKISVKNSCAEAIELDVEGLPVVKPREGGHGIGLRSV